MANKDGIIISRSQVWTLAHEMICCLTNLIETSRCWRKLESTTMKTSLIYLEREAIFVESLNLCYLSFWHPVAGMILSFIISTQCQCLKNREDSSKHCHCPMLRLPVWGRVSSESVPCAETASWLLVHFLHFDSFGCSPINDIVNLEKVCKKMKKVCSDSALTSTWQ